MFQKILHLAAIGLCILFFMFVITCTWIGYDVKNKCQEASKKYGGDCVEGLIKTLNVEKNDFRTRNSAIWALGEMGDSRAVSTLEKYYTGDIPKRESLDKAISQYELSKALKLTHGGFNITKFVWRK